MKRLSIVVVLLAVAALGELFHAPSVASAAPAGMMHSKGAVADALFKSMLDDGCTEFDTWVSAGVWTDARSRGHPVKHSGLMVQIDVWNACEPFLVDRFQGFTETADVKLSGQHGSAAGTVEVADFRGNSDTLHVSVDWDAENAPPGVIGAELPNRICTFQGNAHVRTATATGAIYPEYGDHNYSPDHSVWADTAAGHGALCTYSP